MIISFHPSAQETDAGNSEVFQDSGLVIVGLFVSVSDVNGLLPSLTVTLQHSPDNTNWYNVGSIAVTRTTVGNSVSSPAALAMLADYSRIIWTIAGTVNPNFTFAADVVVHKTRQ